MNEWNAVLSRLSTSELVDIDDIIHDHQKTNIDKVSGDDRKKLHAKPIEISTVYRPCSALWSDMRKDEKLYLGIAISKELNRPAILAAQLAALALERDIEPIIFSRIGMCGLERFGFRVEDTSQISRYESQDLEEQLCNFWGIEMVIDASRLSALD